MRILGLVFSSRKVGNCTRCINYSMEKFRHYGHEVEVINLYDLNISPCKCRTYHCFRTGKCAINDDLATLYNKCFQADKIVFAIPTYSGHLSSMYFAFSERSQAIFKDDAQYHEDFLKKISLILIGNLGAGGDMALHEALYPFTNQNFYPETLLLSSKEYSRKSTAGDLVEEDDVKRKLKRFVEKIINP